MSLPKHPKTKFFLDKCLFKDLKTFAELEQRISQLSIEKERGDALEVFAEAYLATQTQMQAGEIRPSETIPQELIETFGLGSSEKGVGIDGIFKTNSAETHAYQVKFRSNRKPLTWRELSSFFGMTGKFDQRLVFSNSDSLSNIVNRRPNFYKVLGYDLDRLEEGDLNEIVTWLQGTPVPRPRKTPWPHQNKAREKILYALGKNSRVTSLMACATGKTLLSLWIAEEMITQGRILVLVPSLALLRQTLHWWMKETRWRNPSVLCVCSDPTVTKKRTDETDEVVVRQSDLDFPVSTDKNSVREFLDKNNNTVQLIFSTYQSANVVAEGMGGNEFFDLAIFDEAHKTTGKVGTRFSLALRDEKLPIKKRLFLTATPRHYNIRKKDKEGDAKLVFSMDVPEIYGDVAFKLPFAEAAQKEIISDCKIIISVVTSNMVNDELIKRGEVIVKGDVVKARHVADQIALKSSIEKFGVKKIISFHSRVDLAKSFTGSGGEGINNHLPDFKTFHANGSMPTAEREDIMRAFRNSDCSLISNARCLTEGVDIPAVDMVAFMSPKKSPVDIVQATGRALRKDLDNPNKTTGYVLVPIFLELVEGESIEEAVKRTDFGEVWDILEAIKEHDDVLAEIIQKMREEKGGTRGNDGRGFRGKVEILGPSLDLEILRKFITTICVEELGVLWDERYGELKAFKEKFGHCNVPQRWPENSQLGVWVGTQRDAKKKGILSEDRIQRLDKIGFVWDQLEAFWEENFASLVKYEKKHGNCNVPNRWPENPKLGVWVGTQRWDMKKGILSEDRIRRLDEIEFAWDPFEELWEENFASLVEYKGKYGNYNVPVEWPENPQLGKWVATQRTRRRKGTLSEDRIRRLDEIGFVWDLLEASWEENFASLVEYKRKYGNCNVPGKWPENPKLGQWVWTQRRAYRKKEIHSEDRIRRLDEIGFVWDQIEASWEENFASLVEFKRKYGNCNVPQRWPENLKLGKWVGTQRGDMKRGILSEDRIRRLDEIGFVWDPYKEFWEEKFASLVEYKRKYGNCNVPSRWPENPKLGQWVSYQRVYKKNGILSEDHIRRLDKIGFAWDQIDASWEENFASLVEYKRKYGNCNVPVEWPENPNLGPWVSRQRTYKKKGILSEDRIRRLDEIGFAWDPHGAFWEENFASLVEYEKKYGNCNVPFRWSENHQLGQWVYEQRRNKKKGILSEDCIRRLEELSFRW